MSSDESEGKRKHFNAEWIKSAGALIKDGEDKPLLNPTNKEPGSPEEKQEKFMEMGMRLLHVAFECCLPMLFRDKDKAAEVETVIGDVAAEADQAIHGLHTTVVTQAPHKLDDIKEADEEVHKLSEVKEADDEVHEAVVEAEAGIEDKLVGTKGGEPGDFTLNIISYRKQVTVGVTYFTKIKLNEGPEHIHARIYKPVEGDSNLVGELVFNKTESDEIEYF